MNKKIFNLIPEVSFSLADIEIQGKFLLNKVIYLILRIINYMKKYQMTKAGLLKVEQELESLINRRSEISEKIKYAKEQGDLKENAEYHEAKNDMSFNESRILELQDIVRNSQIITHKDNREFVSIGSTIRVESKFGVKEYTLVGATEANPLEGKISDQSPLGSAFMNRKSGEEFEVETPAGMQKYKILEIIS